MIESEKNQTNHDETKWFTVDPYVPKTGRKSWWIEFGVISALMALLLLHFLYWHIKYKKSHQFGGNPKTIENPDHNYKDGRISTAIRSVSFRVRKMSDF